jgi:hypothetical protein
LRRPDEDLFELFSRHFERIDPVLERFAERHGFRLERNANRQPCRILRRSGNPEQLIDIYLDDHWLQVDYTKNLPHSIAAASFYEPDDHSSLWKLNEGLIEHQPFSVIQDRLEECLDRAAGVFASWTPELIMRRGERLRNLKREYERGMIEQSEEG